ncbi:hypothetical protein MC885_010003, partial [Smutsia gigantea]
KEESLVTSDESNFENSKIADIYIPTIVCSHEDKEDLEISNPNVEAVNREHDEHNEKELELMINQRLIRSSTSRDKRNTFSRDPVKFPNKAEGLEKKQIHGEEDTDMFKRPFSPSTSAESSLKGNLYCNERYSSENECSHQPLEEIASDLGEIEPSLVDTSSDELVQLHTSSKEVLDDNANPAQRRGRVQISCPYSFQLMADNNKKHEGGAQKIEIKDWDCLRRDFHSDFHMEESTEKESSKKDYDNGKNEEEEQRIYLGINKKQSKNFQPILHDQERKTGHSEINVEGTEVSNRGLTFLPSRDTSIPNQEIKADTFHSPRKNLNWEEAMLTAPELDLSTSEGTTLGGMPGQVCSPKNGNVLRNDYFFQVEEEKSDCINPEVQNKKTQHKQSWNVLESQGKARESKTNITEHIKEQADCEDMWKKRDNTRILKATSTKELFICQETVSCELSSLADHGITEKAGASTAYIIKTTSESTPESMSAREKAIIAKIPQETARSDRPIEVKETAFDPHEGRNDDSHYILCERDTVGVLFDNDFERESHLGHCNVHVDKMEKEETISMYNPGKTHDRKKHCIGNVTSVEESLQVITGNQKAASKLDLHLGMIPTDKKIFPENRDHVQAQELSKKMGIHAVIHSALNSDTNRAPQNGSHVSNHQPKPSVPFYEWAIEGENIITPMTIQSISTKSECNCNPTSEIQGIKKHPLPGSIAKEVSKSSGIVKSGSRRERLTSQMIQQGDSSVEKSLQPTTFINEAFESLEEPRQKDAGLVNLGQPWCSSGEGSGCSASVSLPTQENQAQSSESLLSKYINSKIPYFLLFLIFLVTIYQYDLMTGLAFYLFSLYWLSWEGGRQKESVKK